MTQNTSSKNNIGTVIKKTISDYGVLHDGQVFSCTLSPHLRKELIYTSSNPGNTHKTVVNVKMKEQSDRVTIGDQVQINLDPAGSGIIVDLLPRKNKFTRRTAVPMPTAHPFEQVIAANIDQVMPVFAASQPTPKWNMLDRYLISAESLDVQSLICITKLDLARSQEGRMDEDLENAVREYQKIGYPAFFTSTVNGEGLDELKAALQGKITVLVGKSGVGKTSLLNAIQPGLALRASEVNQVTGKGRHTTTWVEMLQLTQGGAIIDTPGVRGFGLWNLDTDDLAAFFPEMRPFLGQCRFGANCQHEEEPGCAIRKAVINCQVSPRRYQSYLRLKTEGYFYD
jgi:ribosome biogenesis GTPase / thiamine phosphate phosphatase